MSLDPQDPRQVAMEIGRLSEILETTTGQYRTDIEYAATLQAQFKGHWARAMLDVIQGSSKSTVSEREARCEIEVNELRVIADIAEARAKATKEALTSMRVQIDALRSLGANLRVHT